MSLRLTSGERLPLFMPPERELMQVLLDLAGPTRIPVAMSMLDGRNLLGWGLGQQRLGAQTGASVYVVTEENDVLWVDSDAFWTSTVLSLKRAHPGLRRIQRSVTWERARVWCVVAAALTAYVLLA
jgi:hypothetical protein